jgi:hypothetical protein
LVVAVSYYAGIDYSTHAIDVVLVDEDTGAATWHRTELEGNDAFDRARSARDTRIAREKLLPPFMSWDDVVAVGIEDPRGHNAGALYRVQGAILAQLPVRLLVHPLIPSQWRKLVGLPGDSSKQQVASWALKQPGIRDWPVPIPFDATDAYCIALAVSKLVREQETALT